MNKTRKLPDEQMQAIARAVADPRRFAILQQIAASRCTACSALKAHEDVSPATISHHMKELSEAGLIAIEREGRTADLRFQRAVWGRLPGATREYLDSHRTFLHPPGTLSHLFDCCRTIRQMAKG